MAALAVLDGPAKQIMDGTSSVLVRQKLDLMEEMFPICPRQNMYRIVNTPADYPEGEWDDTKFWNSPQQMVFKEESDLMCRICLANKRELTVHVSQGEVPYNKGGQEIYRYEKPFKCTFLVGCTMCNPPEINTVNNQGATVGKVVQDWRCFQAACCGKLYYRATDNDDKTLYVIRDDHCCNTNQCAPSCCCKVRRFDIFDAAEENVVGQIQNIFSCSIKRCCFPAVDQYKVVFPPNATAEEKAILLSAQMLIEYEYFEKQAGEN